MTSCPISLGEGLSGNERIGSTLQGVDRLLRARVVVAAWRAPVAQPQRWDSPHNIDAIMGRSLLAFAPSMHGTQASLCTHGHLQPIDGLFTLHTAISIVPLQMCFNRQYIDSHGYNFLILS